LGASRFRCDMTLDTLIAILALVAAVYAILPRSRRLDLRLRLRPLDWFLIGVALVGVHLLVFYPSLQYVGFLPEWPFQEQALSPKQSAYLLLLLLAVFLALRVWIARLSRGQVFHLQKLIDELIRSQDYAALFSLLDKNLKRLHRIAIRDFFLPRLRSRLEGSYHPARNFEMGGITSIVGRVLARLLPTYERHTTAGGDILHQILVSHPVVSAIVRLRPYFALRLLDADGHEIFDFVDIYFRLLLEDKHSILYFELRSNQNLDWNHKYWLPQSNRLLFFLFSDARKAETLGAWKPIGEALISMLDDLAANPEGDPYNRAMGEFHERNKWGDPLFVGIFFFDVMVSSALHQGVKWHMWLYYFPHFVKGIVRNYRIAGSLVDTYAEWPTKYSYLLYRIVTALTDWLEAAASLPTDQGNVQIQLPPMENENGNIPKSAAFALTDCMRQILLAEQIPEQFRRYLTGIVYRTYFELRSNPKTEQLATVIRCRMSQRSYHSKEEHRRFQEALSASLAAHDKLHYDDEHVRELDRALKEGRLK